MRVYPRAGGGTGDLLAIHVFDRGLSPRRRGNRRSLLEHHRETGSIPAQAGEPRSRCLRSARRRVYPRAGGGTMFSASIAHGEEGLSPRRRGNPRAGGGTGIPGARRLALQGLSPRRRGNRIEVERIVAHVGSIPAQAGEPLFFDSDLPANWVYPRAGGGTADWAAISERIRGLSPRRRGNRRASAGCGTGGGSIPAQAGEPWRSNAWCRRRRVYPRAGGGTSRPTRARRAPSGLSPRRRGNPRDSWHAG